MHIKNQSLTLEIMNVTKKKSFENTSVKMECQYGGGIHAEVQNHQAWDGEI
jgi:hypothetical protein